MSGLFVEELFAEGVQPLHLQMVSLDGSSTVLRDEHVQTAHLVSSLHVV